MKPFLTTPEAAVYLGFKTTGGVRKAIKDGRLRPAGRRGGTGPYVFEVAELDRFLLGTADANLHADRPGRLHTKESPMDKKFNNKLGNSWVRPTRLPGVFEKKGGGYVVRARVKDPMTGTMREIRKVLDVENERLAFEWLEDEKVRLQSQTGSGPIPKQRFGDFAVSLLEKKIQTRDIRSPAGRDRWKHSLNHLIVGTHSKVEDVFVPGFGELAVDEIRVGHVDRWREGVATLIAGGDYSPNTANGG